MYFYNLHKYKQLLPNLMIIWASKILTPQKRGSGKH